MDQTLAAASMLLAALALVLDSWGASIQDALDRPLPPHDAARKTELDAIATVMWRRALPLAITSTLLLLIYLRRDWSIIASVFKRVCGEPGEYDDVAAAFALTQVLTLMLAFHTWGQVVRLGKRS